MKSIELPPFGPRNGGTIARIMAAAFVVAALVAACGDHVVVPNDKTGKCVAGLLTKCGDTCVDTQTDIANCGACAAACGGAKVCVQGKCTDSCPPGSTKCGDVCSNTDVDRANCGMCGKACAMNEVCAKGKCAPTCEAAGYLTCAGMMGPVDAGGATSCVNPDADEKNCGGCNIQCAMSESCVRGICCTTGLGVCNGACVELRADPKNCGSCGTVCTMNGPSCVLGSCSKCNNTILLLPDSQTGLNATIKAKLESNGFVVTLIDNGSATYTGMPAATGFGAVLLMRGNNEGGTDMPANGQQAIVAAQGAGSGIILDGYDNVDMYGSNRLQSLKPLSLFQYNTGAQTVGTVQNIVSQFPFFAGIANAFGTANTYVWYHGGIINGGAQDSQFIWQTTYLAGLHRSSPNGRIVQFGVVLNYVGGQNIWTADPYMLGWVLNGIRWASGCTN